MPLTDSLAAAGITAPPRRPAGKGPVADLLAGATSGKPTPEAPAAIAALAARPTTFDPAATSAARAQLATALTASTQDPAPIGGLGGALGAVSHDVMGKLFGVDNPEDKAVDNARAALEEALRSERENAIGADKPARKARPMTEQSYDDLNGTQRAAVDFNTMLTTAVRRDHRLADKYPAGGDAQYDDAVSQMFGPDRGSEQYAPETLAVLRQIGFSDPHADLNDFLGLRAAIRQKDIDRMVPHDGPTRQDALQPLINPAANERYQLSLDLAHATEAMQSSMARGNQLLGNINQTAVLDRNDDVAQLGGVPHTPKAGVGYEPPSALDANGNATDLNTYFQLAFEKLANKEVNRDQVIEDANRILSPESLRQFTAYLDERSQFSERYALDLGATDGVKYRTPEEFRQLLGLDSGGSDG